MSSGFINSFMFLVASRVIIGSTHTAFMPATYSLIGDYFPTKFRSRVNALITCGHFLGYGLASLIVILIANSGWRSALKYVGGFGFAIGALILAVVKEPTRGIQKILKKKNVDADLLAQEEEDTDAEDLNIFDQFKVSIDELMSNKAARYIALGSMLKYTMPNFFIPSYFLTKFPMYSKEFGLVFAIINIFMGPLAAVTSGILSDKYASKKSTNYMANPWIIIAGNCIALPALLISMTTNNFWLSVGLMSFKVLGFENWWPINIAMI